MRLGRRWDRAPIYISYRRSQSAAIAHHLHDMLTRRFGRGSSFLDVRDIPPGERFPAVLLDQLAHSRVVLVVIGPEWLAASDPLSHRRRLDDPADWVFQEVREALAVRGRLVVPVLIGDHPVPRADHLPPAIAGLASREARHLRHESLPEDFAALADHLAKVLDEPAPEEPEPSMRFMAAVVRSTISDVIGTKYIPSLYVSRGTLEQALSRHVSRSGMRGSMDALVKFCDKFEGTVGRLVTEDNLPAADEIVSVVHDAVRDIRELVTDIDRAPLSHQDHLTRSTRVAAHGQVIAKVVTTHLDRLPMSGGRRNAAWRRANERRKVLDLLLRMAEEMEKRARTVERAARPVVAVVERAGRGKTNLLCDFAIRCADAQPVVFQVARSIGPGRRDLRSAVAATLQAVPGIKVTDLGSLGALFGRRRNVAVFIDGINENADPAGFARQLRKLVQAAERDNVRFVLTCREEYWPVFEPELRDLLAEVHLNVLGKFGPRQYETAVDLYFRHFTISGEIVGDARAALHDPLLLRFFCEAYANTRFSEATAVTEIRRLPLFELYTTRKIKHIVDLHPEVGQTYVVDDYIELLAEFTASSGRLSLSRRDLSRVLPRGDTTSTGSVYRMLLDEDLIIEENLVDFDVRVGFVYEAFMEYVLSRTIIRRTSDADRALAGIEWHRDHEHFINRIGVLGFYLAHLFTTDHAAFRRLLTFFGDDGRTASLAVIRLAVENLDAARLDGSDIALVLSVLVDAVCAPHRDGRSPRRREDREEQIGAVHGVLDGLARVGTASFGLLLEHLMGHADRLRDGHHAELVGMLEALGEHDDRILLLALWERLRMPSPALGLRLSQVTKLEDALRRDRPRRFAEPEHGRILAEIGRRWLAVAPRLDPMIAEDDSGRMARFRQLMQTVARRWATQHGSSPVTLGDIVRFAVAERPAETVRGVPGSGRRYRRARGEAGRSGPRSPGPDN